jgi:hypothetical protein
LVILIQNSSQKRQTIRLIYKAYSCEERQMKFGSQAPLLAEFEGKITKLMLDF